MGEYAHDDQRDVHSSETAEWRETEQQQQQQRQPQDGDAPASMGYGNAHDAAGVSEQEKAQAASLLAQLEDMRSPHTWTKIAGYTLGRANNPLSIS